jgi:hypothetical protein
MVLPSQFLPHIMILRNRYCKWCRLAKDAPCKFDFHEHYMCYFFVGFEVLVAMVMENSILWDTRQSSACYPLHADFLFALFFNPEDGGDIFS